jgi:uncharacterized caspase-like protein
MSRCLRSALAGLALILALAWGAAVHAQERRVALVIGNSAYVGEARLPNAVRDAELIAGGLREIGFDVTLHRDLDNRGLRAALQAFEAKAEGTSVAAIYFAGHGIAANGRNWMLPVDARLTSARHIEDEAVAHTRFAAALEGARGLQLLILDACRNNPFAPRLAAGGGRNVAVRGLEPINDSDLPPNRLIAFSARDGQVAQDGPAGGNGPYAEALRKRLSEPGTEIGLLFRKVRDDVINATRRSQEPWAYNSLGGQELFLSAASRPLPTPVPAPTHATSDALDLAFWQSIQASTNPADFVAYRSAFPQGRFLQLAINRLSTLRPAAPPAAQVAPPVVRSLTPEEVAAAQRHLTALGFNTGGSDGVAGPRSQTALADFAHVSLRQGDTQFDTVNLERLQSTEREFMRLTERGAVSPRGRPASGVTGAAARFERGWLAETAAPSDSEEAAYWYGLAAREHEPRALNQLGLLLVRGQGVAKDAVGGSLLWRLAAARGDATAAFNLGAMLERGIGLDRNLGWARYFYDMAAHAGHPQARDAARRVTQ